MSAELAIRSPAPLSWELRVPPLAALAVPTAILGMIVLLAPHLEVLGGNAVPLTAVGLSCLFPVIAAARRGAFDPFAPIWLYILIYFLEYFLKPLLTLVDRESFGITFFFLDYSTSATTLSLSLAFLGLLAFYAGYYGGLGAMIARSLPRLGASWAGSRHAAGLLSALAGFALLIRYFFAKGGYSLEAIYANRAQLNANAGEFVHLVHLFGWLAIVLSFRLFRQRMRSKPVAALACLGVAASVVAAFAIFGSRWSLLFGPASLVLVWHYSVRPLRIKVGLGVVAGFFLLSSLFGAFRGDMRAAFLNPGRIATHVAEEVRGYHNWDVLLAICQYYPAQHDFYYGRLAGGSLMWLIPRRVWSSKPYFYGPGLIQEDLAPGLRQVADGGGFSGSSFSQSTLGEGYADFGVAGALLYMFLFGAAWSAVYRYARLHSFHFPVAALYGLIYIGLPVYVRGFSSPLVLMLLWLASGWTVFKLLEGRKAP